MAISIAVESSDIRTTAALFEWLRREDGLRGRVQIKRLAPQPGHMGDLANIITVAIGSGGVVSILLTSLSTWLSQRRNEVSVEVTFPDGRSIKVSSRGRSDPDTVLKDVLAQAKGME